MIIVIEKRIVIGIKLDLKIRKIYLFYYKKLIIIENLWVFKINENIFI